MSGDRFRIESRGDGWFLEYPDRFSFRYDGVTCAAFADAVSAFIAASNRWCVMGCGSGGVVDTATGWECTNCGASDTAVVSHV